MESSLKSVAEKLKVETQVATLTEGTSMRPMLRQHKDIVVIERIARPIVKHDVLLYSVKNKEKLVLHRVLRVEEDRYIIRGDNTYRLEYVPKKAVIGVLKEFYRDGKYFDCATNKKYKTYIFFMRFFYPFRYFWKVLLIPFLVKIKHKIFKFKYKQ